jgi:hypothetical protein
MNAAPGKPGIAFRIVRWIVQAIRFAWIGLIALFGLGFLVAAFQIAGTGDWFVVVIVAVVGFFAWLAYRTSTRKSSGPAR